MKKLLLAVGVLASTMAFSQSHGKGTMQVHIGWQSTLGGADFETTATAGGVSSTSNSSGVGAKSGFGARFQYGIADAMSVGGYLRTEKAGYVSSDIFSAGTIFVQGVGIGAEAKYYIVNKDKFTFHAGPQIGFSTGKSYYTGFGVTSDKKNISGLSYGVMLGINYFFTDMIGLSFDLGYGGGMLKQKYTEDYFGTKVDIEGKVTNGGVTWASSLVLKFGGK